MKNVYLVVGTRPDAIKMAPVYRALKEKQSLNVRLVSTGQHKDLLGQVFDVFGMRPDIDLDVMRPGQSLTRLTVGLLSGLENVFSSERPDLLLAHGDTTTCYASALSSFYHSIPFFHVEAGLRSHRLDSPFPEEFNRQSVAQLAAHHFAPTEIEKKNLIQDGVSENEITVTGATIRDAIDEVKESKNLPDNIDRFRKIVVLTMHRRESTEELSRKMTAVRNVAQAKQDVVFVFPVHPSPVVSRLASEFFISIPNVILTNPLRYPDFISLLKKSSLILTDSGGIQEEAVYLGKKVFLLRDVTEREDGLVNGLSKILGNEPEKIEREVLEYLNRVDGLKFSFDRSLKRASDIIAEKVEHFDFTKCYA